MKEVIAKRKNSLFGVYGAVAVIGVFLLFLALSLQGDPTEEEPIWAIVAAVLVLAVGVGVMIAVACTPNEAITLEGDTLHFAKKFSCNVKDVTRVAYRQARARGIHYAWGKIIVYVGEKKIQYSFIENVEDVQLRLLALAAPKAEEKEE